MEIKRLSPNRINDAVSLANSIFRPDGGSMGKDFPLLFSKKNARNILYIEKNGKIVSILGLLFREIQIYGVQIKTTLIGSVCTEKNYRGKGYTTSLMNEAAHLAIEEHSPLMLISGDLSVYRKFGAVNAGIYFTHPVFGKSSAKYKTATIGELPLMEYLHATTPVRFIRTPEEFEIYFNIGKADNMPSEIFVSDNAYVVISNDPFSKDDKSIYHCVEHGGPESDVKALLLSISKNKNPLILHTTAAEHDLNKAFWSEKTRKRGFIGTVKILDKELFLDQLTPFLHEANLKINFNKEGDLSAFTRYIFGSTDTMEDGISIPLPDYGMDYV